MAVGVKLGGSKTDDNGATVTVRVFDAAGSEQTLTVVTELAAKVAHSIKQGEFRARFQQEGGVSSALEAGASGIFSGPRVGEFRIDPSRDDGVFGLSLVTTDGAEYYFMLPPEAAEWFRRRLPPNPAA